MPALINLAANFAFGAAMGAVRQRPGPEGYGVGWPLLLLLLFEACVAVPVTTYLLRFYPHWSLFYVFDPQVADADAYVGLLSVLSLIAHAGAGLGSFVLTQRATRFAQPTWRWGPTVAGGATALLLLVVCWRRVWFVGSYDAFLHGNGRILPSTLPGVVGLLSYAAGIGLAVWTHRRRQDRVPIF